MFTSQNEMLFPILNIKGEIYDKIINHFNNSKEEKQRLHNIKQYKLLTFFHLFYYNLSLCIEEKGLQINWDDIYKEYDEIIAQILKGIELFDNNSNYYIIFDFNKTMCVKNLLKQGYKIVKDEFKMIIIPVSIEVRLLDENYIEYDKPIKNNIELYIYSVISANPKLNEDKLKTILKIKMIRLLLF